MKIAFIINRLVSSKKKIEGIFSSFSTLDLALSFFETEYAGHSTDLAKQITKDKFDWIVSVGGDGTLNEIVNGIMDDSFSIQERPKLAMYPVGTGNDYSVSIRTTKNPNSFINAIKKDKSTGIDIGKIISPKEGIRYFINVADAGMGGEVTQRIKTSGNVIGKWVYYKTILKSFFTYKRPTLKIILPDKEIISKVITVVIAKGKSFGGGYKVGYDAKLNDGKFFIAIVGDISVLTYLMKIPKLMRGKKIEHPDVSYLKTDQIKLENISEHPCHLEMDGEPGFTCPVELKCLANQIQFLDLGD